MQTAAISVGDQPWWVTALLSIAQGGPTAFILLFVLWAMMRAISSAIDKFIAARDADRTALHEVAERIIQSIEKLAEKHEKHKDELEEHVSGEHEKTRDIVRERTVRRP